MRTRTFHRLLAVISAGTVALMAGCAGSTSSQNEAKADQPATQASAKKAAPGTLEYDKNLWHQLLTEHANIRRTVKHTSNGVEALTESDDPATAAKITEHAKAMQARMKSGSRVRVWDPVFAELFAKHGAVKIEVTPTAKGVKIVESSDDPEAVALLRSHAMGVSTFVREGFASSPNETLRYKVGDPVPVDEVAIGGVKHRILLGQPDAAQLAALQAEGMSTVVNFRKAAEHAEYDEQGATVGAGMEYCNIAYKGDVELTDEVIDASRAAIKAGDAKGEAIVLHCRTGNRAGPGWAAYRVLDKNVTVEQAISEARAMQMVDPKMEARTREYIQRRMVSK